MTLLEIRKVMECLAKDKSPGLDGWTVEIFIAFFDLMGHDLLEVLEESRIIGKFGGVLNATFVALIPKCDKPSSYNDFRPISLCNVVYKVITKVITNMIKCHLSKFMSKEEFGFLDDMQILDAIGVEHEFLHNIKINNHKYLVLKLDIVKACDRVNWDYLRLVILQIELSLEANSWIMGHASFPILLS